MEHTNDNSLLSEEAIDQFRSSKLLEKNAQRLSEFQFENFKGSNLEDLFQPNDLWKEGLLILDRYRIVRMVGEGGNGTVYAATDEQLGRTVALKRLLPALGNSAQFQRRLKREAKITSTLSSPNSVSIFDICEHGGTPFIVMEFVDGPSVAEFVARKNGQLSQKQVAVLATQVANSLSIAHAQKVIHRDVKCSNILLEHIDENGHLVSKLTDFGLAKEFQLDSASSLTMGGLIGTPLYMSPEQILDPEHIDERTDVYSLGISMYELLARRKPFRGGIWEIVRQVIHKEPVHLRKIRPDVCGDLILIVQTAINKDRERRYSSITEMSDDIQRWLEGRTIKARKNSFLDSSLKFVRRHPVVSGLLAATIFLGLVSTSLAVSLSIEKHRVTEKNRQLDETSKKYTATANLSDKIIRGLENEGVSPFLLASIASGRMGTNSDGDVEPEVVLPLYQGILNLGEGKLPSAVAELRKAQSLDPERELALMMLSLALFNSGEHQSSKAVVEKLVKLKPNCATGHAQLAKLLFIEASDTNLDPKSSEKLLTQSVVSSSVALKLNPQLTAASDQLIESLVVLERFDETTAAIARYGLATATKQRSYIWMLRKQGKYHKALSMLNPLIENPMESSQSDHCRDFVSRAKLHRLIGQTDNAIHDLELVSEMQKELPESLRFTSHYNELGLLLLGKNRFQEALGAFNKVATAGNDWLEINKALAFQGLRQFDEAIEILNTVKQNRPNSSYVAAHLRQCLLTSDNSNNFNIAEVQNKATTQDQYLILQIFMDRCKARSRNEEPPHEATWNSIPIKPETESLESWNYFFVRRWIQEQPPGITSAIEKDLGKMQAIVPEKFPAPE